jgi:EmrB/QacA subfamily drug resistance transporter
MSWLRRKRSRWAALVVVCCAQMMSVVDATIVNVALPSIQRSLHFSPANLTWVVNAYLISFGSFLLLAGRVGDLVGRRRIFLAGVALFTVSSAACGLADSQGLLIVARFVQGFGGAGAASAIVAIIATEFPEPHERAKAMSVYLFVISGGASIGLITGGIITQVLNWHWIFFVNVPIGILTWFFARIWIHENEGLGIGRDLDVLGAALVTAAMMIGAYAIVTSSTYGWGSTHTLVFGAIAVALLVGFAVLESNIANPIMPLRILHVPGLSPSSAIRALMVTAMFASLFIGVLYLQHVLGYGVLKTGIAFLPQTIVMFILSAGPVAWIARRFGLGPPLLSGVACCCAAMVLLTQVGPHTSYWELVFPSSALIGAGAALAFMPLLVIAMARVPPLDAGLASGVLNTSFQLSGALAVAVLGTIAANRTTALTKAGSNHIDALLSGYRLAFLVAAISAGFAFIGSVALLRRLPHWRAEVKVVAEEPAVPLEVEVV